MENKLKTVKQFKGLKQQAEQNLENTPAEEQAQEEPMTIVGYKKIAVPIYKGQNKLINMSIEEVNGLRYITEKKNNIGERMSDALYQSSYDLVEADEKIIMKEYDKENNAYKSLKEQRLLTDFIMTMHEMIGQNKLLDQKEINSCRTQLELQNLIRQKVSPVEEMTQL